eukprot:s385_g15.t1
MKTVKEALIKHLGKPELLQTCRLVQRAGENGAFSGFKDSERLNSRRALLARQRPPVARVAPQREPPKLTVPQDVGQGLGRVHKALRVCAILCLWFPRRDLLQGFSDVDFQSKRKELIRLYKHSDPKRFGAERQKLFLSVQKIVLPNYGFEAGPKGVFDMMEQFDRPEFVMNAAFQQQGAVLNQLLFADDLVGSSEVSVEPNQSQVGRSPRETSKRLAPEVVRDIEVIVRHAVQENHPYDEAPISAIRHCDRVREVRVTVKSNATMKAVKEALIKHLGKPELLQTCRLVQRVGENGAFSGAFSGFKDSEKLNNRRALLVLGIPSLRTAGDEALDLKAPTDQSPPRPPSPPQSDQSPPDAVQVTPQRPPVARVARDLLQGFSDADFQAKRKELIRLYKHSDPKRFGAERQKLFLSVQKIVLPKYGFEGSPKGVFEMLQQFDRPEFAGDGDTLNQLLFADELADTEASQVSKPRKEAAKAKNEATRDVEVIVRHAVEEDHPADEEVRVTVKSNATMKAVKEALIKHLGKPELLQTCRLVQRVGENGAFSGFKDSEKLNNRRALLVLGIPSLRTAGDEALDLKAPTHQDPQPEVLQRPLVARVAPASREAPKLTVPLALALQRDLLQGFSDADFQSKRKELVRLYKHSDPKRFSAERQKLFLSVQKFVLPKYGFEGGPKGVFDMLQQFDRSEFMSNSTIMQQGDALNQLLFADELPEETLQEQKKSQRKNAGKQEAETEVLLTIRNAIEEDHLKEVQLKVKNSWTIKEIKQALAEQLEDPQVLQTCHFVRRVGESGAFSSLTDSERLGKRRNLLVIGLQNIQSEERLKGQRKSSRLTAKAVKITPAQAIALQKDLYDGFSAPTFRTRLEKLWEQKPTMEARKFRVERQKLFLSVQSVVLPKYGLEGSQRGVFEMLNQFDQPDLHSNEAFQQMGNMLNDLLYKGEPAVAGSTEFGPADAPKEVQIRVRRAGNESKEEVHVIVPSNASMLDVRKAVARKCNNPSFVQQGRLVKNQGGVLVGYQDSEQIRGRRRLLFVGPPLWPKGVPQLLPLWLRLQIQSLCPRSAMRNRGPGKWREWRWGGTVVPLYPLEGTPAVDPLDPAAAKPLSEIAHLTITKLTAKNCQAKLTDGIAELVKTPDSPGGRFNENRLRQLFKRWSMLRVSLAASGAEVAALDGEKLDEMLLFTGRFILDILGLKKYLSHQVGCSRFRQRILNGSAGELGDDQEICLPVDLQLVILDFWPSEEHEDAKFVSACEQNEVERVEEMLQRPQNPDVRDRHGWPAVHFAAQMGTASCMELLLESRADLEIKATEDGSTALHCATFNGNLVVVKLLLDAGADKSSELEEGATALHLATRGNHLDIARLLIDAGAETNSATVHGFTPLHQAALGGHLEIAQLLLDAGAEQNGVTVGGSTPLNFAAQGGNLEMVQLLLNAGAEKNGAAVGGVTPLHHAAQGGNLEVAQLLLDVGAEKNGESVDGIAPLHLAVQRAHLEVARLLLDAGADKNSASVHGFTPLHFAVHMADLEIARLLIDSGADKNSATVLGSALLHRAAQDGNLTMGQSLLGFKGVDGCTPLHLAAMGGSLAMAQLLLDASAEKNSATKDGFTPLHFAVQLNHLEVARALVDAGVEKNSASVHGFTPLHVAVQRTHLEIARLLLDAGADKNSATVLGSTLGSTLLHYAAQRGNLKMRQSLLDFEGADGCTPLHLAAMGGSLEMAQLLLDAGAEKNSATKDGFTPLHFAVLRAHLEVARLFLDVGAEKNSESVDGIAPLHLAIYVADLDQRLLLDAETDGKTASGQTALHLAAQHQEVEVVRLLLKSGAHASARTDAGEKALHLEIVHLLLAAGVDIDSTAMDLASRQIEIESLLGALEQLLEVG